MPKANFIPQKLKPWIEARQRYQRQFGKNSPDDVRSIENKAADKRLRKEMKKNSKRVALDDRGK